MPTHAWVYRARLTRVIDSDTIVVLCDAGFRIYHEEKLRLLDVDGREVIGASKALGLADKAFTAAWLGAAGAGEWPLLLVTEVDKRDKYGRILAYVWRLSDGRQLNSDLREHVAATGGPMPPAA